ncbi:MAG: 4-oxalocrotonate tautomerase family protein [Xanthomonadales bacterium]|nr:4-oxalocrotonate tautomerase family protein [Xanthomonadales bacterium]
MPYVNIKVTNESVTSEQKRQLIVAVTRLMQDVLNKNPATTIVIVDEINSDNWGVAGEQVTLLRQQAK